MEKVSSVPNLVGLNQPFRRSHKLKKSATIESNLMVSGRTIAEEIDKANKHAEDNKCKLKSDLLPHCDLTVWMRDCSIEVIEPLNGCTSGHIPEWIDGTLLRNGPGRLTVGASQFQHIFDGSALLHRFRVQNGRTTYQNRFLQSNTFKRNNAAQRIVITEFGTQAVPDPCQTIFNKLSAVFKPAEMSDNCMISVYPFGDELYTFTEYPVIHRVDPDTLATLKSVNIGDYVNIVHHSSHPHVLPDDSVFNIGLTVTPKGLKYAIVSFPNAKKERPEDNRTNYQLNDNINNINDSETKSTKNDVFAEAKIVASIPTQWKFYPSYMHTFGLTKNYFVIVEQPLSVSVPSLLTSKFTNRPTSSNLTWFNDQFTLFHLVCRRTGKLEKTFYSEPFFYLHIINQYEDDCDHLIIDICAYKNPSMIECMYIDAMKEAKSNPDYANMFRGRPVRFVLPLNGSEIKIPHCQAKAWTMTDGRVYVSSELLCDMGCETPRINYPAFLGVQYRYFYAISSDVDLDRPGSLIKVDTRTKTRRVWNEEGTFPSEPVFVPHPNGQSEDDGVILSALLWANHENKVALVVLDAKSFIELGRTEFICPGPVPKCLHGWFLSS